MKKSPIIVFGIIILVFLVWGLIGSSESAKVGITCDIGIGSDGSVFCWKWHQNAIGNLGETINNLFNK
jgi:hypothetical protein